MGKVIRSIVALALAGASVPLGAQVAGAGHDKRFELTDPASVAPRLLLPAPPPAGSPEEARELASVRAILAAASPARLDQARRDDATEDPSIFDDAIGVKLERLPATWAMLKLVQNDADRAGDLAKDYFHRTRPWGVDPSLPNCDAGKGKKPTKSYPSGHSLLGYSVGLTLASLAPERAGAALARARDYAESRLVCGAHFPSDVEASHVLGSIVADRLLHDSRLAPRIAAARAELTKALGR